MSRGKKKHLPLPVLPSGAEIVDTHCHLDMADYDNDRDEVIARAMAAGATRLITVGIDIQSSGMAIDLASKYGGVYAGVGMHPHNVAGLSDDDYQILRKLAKSPYVVAYGEIGLDFFKGKVPAGVQEKHFRRQLELAKDLDLPVIIHDREAHDRIMSILQEMAPFPAGGVMHCFSGDAELAEKTRNLGFYISIPGVVTFNKAELLQEVVMVTPLDGMILETDAPFLAPVPNRGKRNEPVYTLYTAAKVADLKGVSLVDLAAKTTANAVKLFRLNENGINKRKS